MLLWGLSKCCMMLDLAKFFGCENPAVSFSGSDFRLCQSLHSRILGSNERPILKIYDYPSHGVLVLFFEDFLFVLF